jgi:hypothetical protein
MYETEDRSSPRIKQLSVFLENRLGALLGVTRVLEAQQVNINAISIMDAADHAVVRMVVDKPTLAAAAMAAEGYNLITTDLLGVALPASKPGGMRKVLQALLMAELDINYFYAVASSKSGPRAILARHVPEMERAGQILAERGFELISQDELI